MKAWHETVGDSLGRALERPAKVLGREQANGLIVAATALGDAATALGDRLSLAFVAAVAIFTAGSVITSPVPSKIVMVARMAVRMIGRVGLLWAI